MQYSYRQSDADLWLYENNDRIMRELRFEKLKNKYNIVIARYLSVRSEKNNDVINNAIKNMDFLQSLFVARGYGHLDVVEIVSRDVDSLELLGMSYDDLLLKLSIINQLSLDVDSLINFPKILSRYSACDLYTAIRIAKGKYHSKLSSFDLALILYLRGRERYDTDEQLSHMRKVMYSRRYYDEVIRESTKRQMEEGSSEELVLKIN